MFYLQHIVVGHLKDCICVREKFPTSDMHAPPFGLKIVGSELAAQERVTVMEVFREPGRILRTPGMDWYIPNSRGEHEHTHASVSLAGTNLLTTSTAEKITTCVFAGCLRAKMVFSQQCGVWSFTPAQVGDQIGGSVVLIFLALS